MYLNLQQFVVATKKPKGRWTNAINDFFKTSIGNSHLLKWTSVFLDANVNVQQDSI